jgi:hypothetical protein
MFFLKRLTNTQLYQRPCLAIVLDLLKQESNNNVLISAFELLAPLKEEVLKCEESFLPKGDPLFLAEFTDLLVEFIEETPCLLLFLKLIFEFVIVSELRLIFFEMLTIFVDLLSPCLKLGPVST